VRTTKTNPQLGSISSLVTAALHATQEPFSVLAAKRLHAFSLVCLTQAALRSRFCFIARARSRHDFSVLLLTPRNLSNLAVLFLIGVAGRLLTISGFECSWLKRSPVGPCRLSDCLDGHGKRQLLCDVFCSFLVCPHSFPCSSSWIFDLRFAADSIFFFGQALVAVPLFVFSMKSRTIA
jgi:hypothetical protein